MIELDNLTLMLAVNAVGEKIRRYERMLNEENTYNKKEVEALLTSYQKASAQLQQGYLNTISQHSPAQQVA